MRNRMKGALAILGRISAAVVRHPLRSIGDEERQRIYRALKQAGPGPA